MTQGQRIGFCCELLSISSDMSLTEIPLEALVNTTRGSLIRQNIIVFVPVLYLQNTSIKYFIPCDRDAHGFSLYV